MNIETIKPIALNPQPSSESNIMTKAIKAYKDELLTGLTDEEREEINKKIKEYLKDKSIQTAADKQALSNYIKTLLNQYGFKGNCEDYAGALGSSAINESESANTEGVSFGDSACMTAYQRSSYQQSVAKTKVFG